MKSKSILIIIFAIQTLYVMAQSADQKTIIRTNHKGIVKSVEYSKEDKSFRIPKSADDFFKDVLKIQTVDGFEKKNEQIE